MRLTCSATAAQGYMTFVYFTILWMKVCTCDDVYEHSMPDSLPYPGYAIQIASYGMRYVGIFAERICVKHP
jgi:hypothetical protein